MVVLPVGHDPASHLQRVRDRGGSSCRLFARSLLSVLNGGSATATLRLEPAQRHRPGIRRNLRSLVGGSPLRNLPLLVSSVPAASSRSAVQPEPAALRLGAVHT